MYNVGQMTGEEKTCSDLLMNTNVIPSLRSLEDLCQDHVIWPEPELYSKLSDLELAGSKPSQGRNLQSIDN